MLIALLAVLGVNLIALVAFAALVISRKRWVKRRPGAFHGVIRVASGEVDGLGPKWGRGYGHWVRDILVWTKAPFLFRNELVPTDRLDEQRPARTDEVKRLGDHPVVIQVAADDATVEVAAKTEEHRTPARRVPQASRPHGRGQRTALDGCRVRLGGPQGGVPGLPLWTSPVAPRASPRALDSSGERKRRLSLATKRAGLLPSRRPSAFGAVRGFLPRGHRHVPELS